MSGVTSNLILAGAAVAPLEPAENPASAPTAGQVFGVFDAVGMADDAPCVGLDAELSNVSFHVASMSEKPVSDRRRLIVRS